MPLTAVRITEQSRRGDLVSFSVDGKAAMAHRGEMLAAALMALGHLALRQSPREGQPRGAFCLMGVCQECLVHVDNCLSQACLVAVREGMKVELRGAI